MLPVLTLALFTQSLAAQDSTTAARPDGGPRCDGETISVVVINRQEPVMVERSAGWARPFLRFALAGAPTRESAVAPFLFVSQGAPCTETLLRESERVLRAQPYLADARATVTPDGAGTVSVTFETVDDIRPVLGLGLKGGSPTRFKLGSANVAGYGMRAAAQWQQGFAFRDGWGLEYTNYHTFGRPYLFDSQLQRSPLGGLATATLSRPLYSQLQSIAWAASAARVDRYQPFVRGENIPTLSLDVERRSWELDAVYRIGGGRYGLFAGLQTGGDRISTAERGVVITDTGFVADDDTTLAGRYATRSRTLVSAILGARALSFFKAEGFDALEGAQDVARGMQIGGLFGHGIAGTDGWFLGGQMYVGGGTPRSFIGMMTSVESGRADGEWADMLAEGRLAWYFRPTRKRIQIVSLEYTGAWRTSVPVQLHLGTDRVGVRGYEDSYTSGARRAVMRVEERLTFPGLGKYLGFGGAAFLDAGKMWAGDVPFGRTVNPRVGGGVGLIFAVPRSSRQNLRVDVGAPFISDPGSSWGVNVTITSGRPRFWRPAPDLARARSAAQTPVVFGWP